MSGLLRSSAVFSAMTFLSRISGLVRDQVYAAVFGANPAMDAFLVAFRIPNFMRRLSAEGSFSMAFVPVLAEYKARGDHAAVKALVDRVAGTLLAALMVLTYSSAIGRRNGRDRGQAQRGNGDGLGEERQLHGESPYGLGCWVARSE